MAASLPKAAGQWRKVGNIAGRPADTSLVESLTRDVAALKAEITELRSKQVANSIDQVSVQSLIDAAVAKAVAAIPPALNGADGASVTVDDLRPLVVAEVEKRVSEIPAARDGKDGVGVMGALIGHDGNLVLTLSDGSVKSMGLVHGRDGKDVDMDAVERIIHRELAALPRPKDGKDGRDGVGFDDMEVVYDGERTFTLKFTKGERVTEYPFVIPSVLYRGVFDESKSYAQGDAVTFGGNLYVAKTTPTMKPADVGDGAKEWQLAVRRGRDGKQGPQGGPGEPGRKGDKGDPGGFR